MKKAFGYLRVSGRGQIDGDGFTRQEEAIRDFAKSNGFTIERIYKDEGISGTLENRPALADLMYDLEENGHGIKTVIIERIDRLARDLMVQEAIIDDLKKQGFELLSASDGDLLEDDPTRKLVRQVLGAIAEYEKTMIVLKLRAARERKKKRDGKCEGRKGYREIAPNIIDEIKRLRRKRKGLPRMSYAMIAEELNEKGYKTVDQKPFTASNVGVIIHRSK
ncbi:MAG: recombinase family protein [Deltaproteobacteria bacterium]|nr:recombinase family protein [Deltaproteobacteria bacterium]